MYDDHQIKKVFASIIILSLIVFLIYSLLPYLGAIFGAVIMYSIFSPLQKKLVHGYHISKGISAGLIIAGTLILVIIPSIYVIKTVYSEVSPALSNVGLVLENIETLNNLVPGVDLDSMINQEISRLGASTGGFVFSTASSLFGLFVNMILLYFIFYYLLTLSDESKKKILALSPFNRRNTHQIALEFKTVTHTTLVVSGIIAVLQGTIIALSFMFFGIPGAFFWGFIATLFAFLPYLGPHLIWIPIFAIKIFQQDYSVALAFLIIGIIISSLDGVLRPPLQKQMGNIHPLVSLIGVFAGVSIFGLWGIIIGPLLLCYLLLMGKMYKEEYLDND
jgi:predicted PurR-regulated permease PerM